MNDKINLAAKRALLERPYEPGIVGFLNDYKLQVVKVKGPFVWHKHDETDDFFLVISGRLTIHLRDRDIELEPGEILSRRAGSNTAPTLKRRPTFSSSSRERRSTLATPAAQ
jgi:hypothetical protein